MKIDDTATAPAEESASPGVQPAATNGAAKPARRARPKVKAARPAKKAAPVATPRAAKAKAKAKTAKPAKKAAKRERDPAKLDPFGYRKGSIRSLAAAMYASKRGATLAEVKAKVGTIQFNVLTELKDRGFKRKEVREASKSGREVTRYFVQG